MPILPGELYLTDIGGAHDRRVVVASREDLNRGTFIFVVPFTTGRLAERRRLSNCAEFDAGRYSIVDRPCVAQADALQPVRPDLLRGPFDRLSSNDFNRVLAAIAAVFDIPAYFDID